VSRKLCLTRLRRDWDTISYSAELLHRSSARSENGGLSDRCIISLSAPMLCRYPTGGLRIGAEDSAFTPKPVMLSQVMRVKREETRLIVCDPQEITGPTDGK
jgi:hypothetical protein